MMDFSEFLAPVPYELRNKEYTPFSLYQRVRFEIDEDFTKNDIVLISIAEDASEIDQDNSGLTWLKDRFYGMSISNWQRRIYDLGTLFSGASFEDTCFALHQIGSQVSESGAQVIVLGGSQAYTYILYKSMQRDLLKVGTIDIKIDIEGQQENLTASNHITKMILDQTHRLLEYHNLGSQAAYVAKEELDILEQLNFEDLRLGKLTEDLTKSEPLLRDLHLLSVDMGVMQYSSFQHATVGTPNGLTEREICGLMRYAGLSNSLKVLHISNFNINHSSPSDLLLTEMLWYYIEAKNNLKSDEPTGTYRVQTSEGEIIFIYSSTSDRWWIEVEVEEGRSLIPCNESDYEEALRGGIPDKWLKFYKKFY